MHMYTTYSVRTSQRTRADSEQNVQRCNLRLSVRPVRLLNKLLVNVCQIQGLHPVELLNRKEMKTEIQIEPHAALSCQPRGWITSEARPRVVTVRR